MDYPVIESLSTDLPTFPQSFPHPCGRNVDEIQVASVDNFVDNLVVARQPRVPRRGLVGVCE